MIYAYDRSEAAWDDWNQGMSGGTSPVGSLLRVIVIHLMIHRL